MENTQVNELKVTSTQANWEYRAKATYWKTETTVSSALVEGIAELPGLGSESGGDGRPGADE